MKAEVIGTPSETEGITVAIGLDPGSARGTVRVEYPMRMVDPSSVALIRQLNGTERLS